MATKVIPGFPGYTITTGGVVTDSNNVVVRQFTDDDGILKVELITTEGRSVMSIQTLIYLTFRTGSKAGVGGDYIRGEEGPGARLIQPIESLRKYLLCFDQDPPETTFVKANIRALEAMPFDGIILAAAPTHPTRQTAQHIENYIWTSNIFSYASYATPLSNLVTTDFRKFKHNFVIAGMHTSEVLGEPPIDWFDPGKEAIFANFAALAEFAKNSGLKGIFWDLEPDNLFATTGWALFKYSNRPFTATHTITDYKNQVRYFGRRIIEAIQEKFPNMDLIISFGYRQANQDLGTAEADRPYGLLQSFLDGLFDSKISSLTIHDWYEDGYNYKIEASFLYGIDQVENPTNVGTDRYDVKRGGALFLDYPASAVYDTSVLANNYFTPTILRDSIQLGVELFSEKYYTIRQEDVKFLTVPPTVPQTIIDTVRLARSDIFIPMADPYDPDMIPQLVARLRTLSMTGFANDDPVTSVTDLKGNIFTQAGATRPVYKTNPFNTDVPSILFTAASSMKLVCDAIAALIHTPGTEDFPYTMIFAIKPLTFSGATTCIASFGRDATTNPVISARIGTAADYSTQRQSDAGTSVIVSSAASTADGGLNIVAFVSTGKDAFIYENNLVLAPTVSNAQDVGVMTLNQFTLGALRINTTLQFYDGHLVEFQLYKRALGMEQVKWLCRGIAAEVGATMVG